MKTARIVAILSSSLLFAGAVTVWAGPPAPAPAATPPAAKPKPDKPLLPPATPAGESKEAREKAAMDLLTEWTAAQNKGDFAAYQALYAKRIVGIRRSGPRVRRFDYKGWMADRQKMFAKKMEVTVEKAVVGGGATLVRLDFVQGFAQGNYKDTGPKRIELTKEEGNWRITREEMLDSKLLPSTPPPQAAAPTDGAYDFGFFVDGDFVLGAADMAWAKTEFTHKGFGNDTVELRARANEKALPAELQKELNDKVRLVRFGGSCVGRLRWPELRGRVVPHFGSRQAWKESDQNLEPAWLTEAWGQSDQELVSQVEGCPEGGIFVRSPSLPEVSPVAPEGKPAPAIVAAARRAFAALPDYKAIDAELKASGGKGHWTQGDVEVLKLSTKAGPVALVWVSAREGVGCGGFAGELTALFKATGPKNDGAGKLDLIWAVPSYMKPVAAFDLDGDALPEILVNTNLWGKDPKDGGALGHILCRDADCKAPAQQIVTPMNDCPC